MYDDDDVRRRIGRLIRLRREQLQRSQQWLAKRADISQASLSRYELGGAGLDVVVLRRPGCDTDALFVTVFGDRMCADTIREWLVLARSDAIGARSSDVVLEPAAAAAA